MGLGLSFGIGPLRAWIPLTPRHRRRRRRATYWSHPGCSIHHTRQDTAERHAAAMRGQR